MSVNLISYTTSKNEELKNLTDIIVYTARVSNPSSQMKGLNTDKLINYLILHGHWSPFEMVDVCIEINTTLDIATQILRHRSFSFQQFSMRYSNSDLAFTETETIRELRLFHPTNRQSSLESYDSELSEQWKKKQQEVYELSRQNYNWAVENGIAKEVARSVLPQSTNTRLYMKGSIRSFIHYIQLRTKLDTQKEHRLIATLIAFEIAKVFPQILSFIQTQSNEKKNDDDNTVTIEKVLTS